MRDQHTRPADMDQSSRRAPSFRGRSGVIAHNYKQMNELSKDAVSWVTVDEAAAGQRIDNFLCRVLKGVPEEPRLPDPAQRRGAGEQGARRARPPAGARATSCGCRPSGPPTARRCPREAGRPSVPRADPLRGRRVPRARQAAGLAVHGGSGIAFGLIEQLRAARPDARVPRARASARPRHVRRAAGRQEARRRWSRCTPRCATATSTSATWCWCGAAGATPSDGARCRCTSSRPPTASGACASTTTGRAAETVFRRVADVAGARSAAGAARGGAQDRAHAPDPRASRAPRLPARGRRQVRRLRAGTRRCVAGPEAHVPACVAPRAARIR